MKHTLKKTVITVGIFSLLLGAVQAQPKVAVIDLRKVFDGYYKTKQADTGLKEEAAELEKQRKDMVDDFKKGETDWKKLLEKANDQAISADERSSSKQAAEKKLVELKEMEQMVQRFEQTSRSKLSEKQRRKRDAILVEIRELVNTKAKSAGYTLVLDVAAESFNNTPIVMYSNGENDLTDSILKQLNVAEPPLSRTDEKPKAETPKTDVKK